MAIAKDTPDTTENKEPLQEAPHLHPAPPCIMVIFGATGDLTKRKLFPAL